MTSTSPVVGESANRGDGNVDGGLWACTSSGVDGIEAVEVSRVIAAASEVFMGLAIGRGFMCSSSIAVSDICVDKTAECDASTRSRLCRQACELQDIIKDN